MRNIVTIRALGNITIYAPMTPAMAPDAPNSGTFEWISTRK